MKVQAGVATDVGRLRDRNEDAYLIREPLFAVADGMGGHRGGDVASTLALEVLESNDDMAAEHPAAGALVSGIRQANQRVLERGEADSSLRGMGTTLTAVLAEDDRAHVAHVGDSRAYLLRDGTLQQITEDHTLVQRMVREGRLEPQEAETHPQRSIVTRAVGVDDNLEIDQLTLDVHPGDRLLLCTDGLSTMIPRERIQEILESEPDPQAAADRLVEEANREGGDDNITVVVLAFVENDSPEGRSADETRVVATPPPRSAARPAEGPEPAPADATRLSAIEAGAAPRDRRAGRRRRFVLWAAGLGVVLVAGLVGTRVYLDRQWYVGDAGGCVAIFKGIPTTVLGYDLSHVVEETDLSTSDLTRFQPWRGLPDGITANSRQDAEAIVDQMRSDVAASPGSAATPCSLPAGAG